MINVVAATSESGVLIGNNVAPQMWSGLPKGAYSNHLLRSISAQDAHTTST